MVGSTVEQTSWLLHGSFGSQVSSRVWHDEPAVSPDAQERSPGTGRWPPPQAGSPQVLNHLSGAQPVSWQSTVPSSAQVQGLQPSAEVKLWPTW
jgi:hypothetical protein